MRKIIRLMLIMVFASIYAHLFTIPLTLVWFQSTSLWSLPCNFLYAGLIGSVIMPTGFLSLLICLIHPGLSQWLFTLATAMLDKLLPSIQYFSTLPGSDLRLATPSLLAVAIWYLLLLAMLGACQLPKYSRRCLATWLAMMLCPWYPKGALQLAMLDVGHGNAAVAEYFTGRMRRKVVMFDVGPLGSCKPTVQGYLRHRGIRRIDAIYLSHWDMDHAGCLAELVYGFDVRRIYGSYLDDTIKPPPQFRRMQRDERHHYADALQIRSWYAQSTGRKLSDNNRSLVTLLSFASQEPLRPYQLLFAGDIEKLATRQLSHWWQIQKLPPLDLLVAPHHGRVSSFDAGLLQQLSPARVVLSNQQPPHSIWATQRNLHGRQVYSTSQAGSILLRTDVAGIQLREYTCVPNGKECKPW